MGVLSAACDPPRPIPPDAPVPDAPLLCMRGPLNMAVTTLAGCEQAGSEDGDRESARFDNPTSVELGPDGLVFVADFDGGIVRSLATDGTTQTVVQRDDFTRPFGLLFDGNRTLFIETDDNDALEHSEATGTIWRFDVITNELAVIARNLGRPRGLALLPDGRIAMADHIHHTVSILDPATGVTTPLAGLADTPGFANGKGKDVRFAQPYDLVVNPDGDLLVTELDNHRIRKVKLDGLVTDYAGSGDAGNLDGPSAVASFDGPQAIAIVDRTIYVTDIRRSLIRRIKDGVVKTIAGDGTRGWIDSQDPRGARFYGLEGIAVDDGRIIIGDGNRGDDMPFHRVRVIDLNAIP
jgi:DNA-binding beta-propeller fold protein YncE